MAIECEIASWKSFRDKLTSEEEKQAFDEVMDMCRMQAAAGSSATNPIPFEPMIMSVLLGRARAWIGIQLIRYFKVGMQISTQLI